MYSTHVSKPKPSTVRAFPLSLALVMRASSKTKQDQARPSNLGVESFDVIVKPSQDQGDKKNLSLVGIVNIKLVVNGRYATLYQLKTSLWQK